MLPQGLLSMSAAAPVSPTGLIRVQYKLGLFREEVWVPDSNLSYGHAKRLAAEIIERKVTLASHALTPPLVMGKKQRKCVKGGRLLWKCNN